MVKPFVFVVFTVALVVGAAAKPQVKFGPAPGGCSKYEILIARGTSEPGPFGSIVGDPLVRNVKKALPGVRGYAVQYPASTDMKNSAGVGMDDTVQRVNKQSKLCPTQKFALVGYSQGAGVVHGAFQGKDRTYPKAKGPRPVLDEGAKKKIVAVVTFGDPAFMGSANPKRTALVFPIPRDFQSKFKLNCAHGDPNCDPKGGNFSNHLKYNKNPWQSESTAFLVAAFEGKSLPDAVKLASDPRWAKYP